MESRKQSSFAVPLFLLVLSVFINYIDRGNLSIAAPPLKTELNISASQPGILLAAFSFTVRSGANLALPLRREHNDPQ